MTLGNLLKATRTRLGRSLRDLEGATGISNGYLSQLESDMIKQPSPNHLHKLADTLGLDYTRLMELAGYIPTRAVATLASENLMPSLPGIEELNEEDRRKILAYIDDLRNARRVRSMSIHEPSDR